MLSAFQGGAQRSQARGEPGPGTCQRIPQKSTPKPLKANFSRAQGTTRRDPSEAASGTASVKGRSGFPKGSRSRLEPFAMRVA